MLKARKPVNYQIKAFIEHLFNLSIRAARAADSIWSIRLLFWFLYLKLFFSFLLISLTKAMSKDLFHIPHNTISLSKHSTKMRFVFCWWRISFRSFSNLLLLCCWFFKYFIFQQLDQIRRKNSKQKRSQKGSPHSLREHFNGPKKLHFNKLLFYCTFSIHKLHEWIFMFFAKVKINKFYELWKSSFFCSRVWWMITGEKK